MRQNFLREHRFLFFTYLAILFIPLAASIFYTANVDAIMRRYADRYQSGVLTREKLFYDSIFRSGKAATATAAANTDTKRLLGKTALSPVDRWTVYTLAKTLADILSTNPYMDSLGVYLCENDSFVTNSNRYIPELYKVYLARYGLTLDEFLRASSGYSGFFITRSGEETCLVIYQNIYDYSLKERCAVSYAVFPWTKIQKMSAGREHAADEAFFLLTRDTTLFGSTAPPNFADRLPDYDTLAQSAGTEEGIFRETADAALIAVNASDELALCYGIYLSKKDFYRDISKLSQIYGAGILLSVLIGTAAALYFTRKNSAPLKHLLSLVSDSGRKNTNISLSGSYLKLEDALLALQRDSRSLSRQLDERRRTAAFETTLAGFLKGIYPNEDWILDFHEKEPKLCGIENYRIALFSFSDIETCKFIRMQKESLESYSLLFFSLKNVLDEVFLESEKGNTGGISIAMDGMVACILPAHADDEYDRQLVRRADTCLDFFQKLFELECCIAVSERHSLWTELSDAYDEAYMALSQAAFLKEESSVHFYSAGQENQEPDGSGLLGLKKNLAGSLMANQYALAKDLADEIMKTCFLRDMRFFTYNQCQAYALSSMFLDKLSDMGMSDEMKAEYSTKLLDVRSTAELEETVNAIFAEIFHYRNLDISDNEWAEAVKAYIQENYSSPELNVSFIAAHFDVSAAHIGNRFRRLTGVGILDYVHTVRLAKCKELLEQGCTIKHCADAAGYTDIKTLQRAFKRYEGITPGQYKEGILKGQERLCADPHTETSR